MSDDGVPVLLTVEEAGELLRVGRSKAYAMAREWRETDGRSGLPVIDLGHVLRVPRTALEELIGADLSEVVSRVKVTEPAAPTANPPIPTNGSAKAEAAEPSVTAPRTRRRRNRIANQLDLFDSNPNSS